MGLYLERSPSSDLGMKRGVKGRDRGKEWEVAIMLQNAAWILGLCVSSKLVGGLAFLWGDT